MPRSSPGKPKSSAGSSSLFPAPAGAQSDKRTSADSAFALIAYIDGGARGNPGPAGFGAHIQDAAGKTVAELSEFLGRKTNNYAEYSGLIAALGYAVEHSHRSLKVVSDSELLVKQIRGEYKVKSPELKVLYDEARRLIRKLDGFEIGHVLRNKNRDADRLANDAMDRGMNKTASATHGSKSRTNAPYTATPGSEKARAQFAPVAEGYVTSPVHAGGEDLARIAALAATGPREIALDIATGGGHTALALAKVVRKVIATDITQEMLTAAEKYLRSKGITNVEYRLADAHALPFDDATLDIVTCRTAPHHFPHPLKFVREVRRVLRPGGKFLLEDSVVPGGEAGYFLNRVEAIRDPSHVRSHTVDEWWRMLVEAGFRVNELQTFGKRHELTEWLDRMHTSADVQKAVRNAFKAASEVARRAFAVEFSNGEPVAYSDHKCLFVCM
jgi:ubiquinone/menaquinone biosynthesis C-methylase UbiE/ribonuclease HI